MNRMPPRCFILACAACSLWLLAPSVPAAPADLTQPYARDVESAGIEGDEILAVRLDSDVYAGASDSLADLRLAAGGAREVPYTLEKVTESSTREVRSPVSVSIDSLRETGSNGLEVVWSPARPGDAATPVVRGFTVETPLCNFERRLTVFGREGNEWRVLVEEALLFDYTRYMDVRRVQVELPPNRAVQFRLAIEDITDSAQSPFTEITRRVDAAGGPGDRTERFDLERRPLRIDRIAAWELKQVETVERDVLTDYGPMPFTVEADAQARCTVISLTSRREPLTQVHLEISSRNFSRAAELQVAHADGVRTEWRTVARATLSVIAFRSFAERQLAFEMPPQRHARYRIVIHDGDSPPLAVTGVRGRGITQRLVFLQDGAESLRLVYGNPDVRPAVYDSAAVLARIRKGSPVRELRLVATAGAPGAPRAPFSWKRLLNSRLFFGAAVVLAVAVLGAMLYSTVRRAGSTGGEQGV